MISIWKSEYTKYFSTQVDIENTNIIFILYENFFNPSYSYIADSHIHDKHEFFFVKKGKCTINIKGKLYHLCSDSFIVIPIGVEHNITDISKDTRIFPVRIQFFKNEREYNGDERISDIYDMLTVLTNSNNTPHIFYNCDNILYKVEELLHTIQESQQFAYQERCRISIMSVLIDTISHMYDFYKGLKIINNSKIIVEIPFNENLTAGANARNKQIYIDIIDGYFNTFYRNEMSLNELADQLNLSSRHTRRLLKHIHGMTFEELTAHTRIKMAKQLLAETNLPLKDICSQVGYSAYSVFFRAFRDITGQSPTEYRKTI